MNPPGLALVATVLNEGGTIQELLDAIDSQTRTPDEIVIVDGGSTDETLGILQRWAANRDSTTIVEAAGAGIAAGRNLAIGSTHSPIVAVTDGGCRPKDDWLEHLVRPIEIGQAEVAMGFYEAWMSGSFERVVSCLNLPDASEVDAERFLPSSRSVAFTREIWAMAGRYPEWLDVGEDMYFDLRVLEIGARRAFVPDAVVEWHLRGDLLSFLKQYYRYARGDAIAAMHPRRHALRFSAYAATAALIAAGPPSLVGIPAVAGAAWLIPAFRRAWRRLVGYERVAGFVAIPVLTVAMDTAKMAGWVSGRVHRASRGSGSPQQSRSKVKK